MDLIAVMINKNIIALFFVANVFSMEQHTQLTINSKPAQDATAAEQTLENFLHKWLATAVTEQTKNHCFIKGQKNSMPKKQLVKEISEQIKRPEEEIAKLVNAWFDKMNRPKL